MGSWKQFIYSEWRSRWMPYESRANPGVCFFVSLTSHNSGVFVTWTTPPSEESPTVPKYMLFPNRYLPTKYLLPSESIRFLGFCMRFAQLSAGCINWNTDGIHPMRDLGILQGLEKWGMRNRESKDRVQRRITVSGRPPAQIQPRSERSDVTHLPICCQGTLRRAWRVPFCLSDLTMK